MSVTYLAKFDCADCQKPFGVVREKGAVKCLDCEEYFLCWDCHKSHDYNKRWKLCKPCATKPVVCTVEGCTNVVKFGKCRDCFMKTLNSGAVCLLD